MQLCHERDSDGGGNERGIFLKGGFLFVTGGGGIG